MRIFILGKCVACQTGIHVLKEAPNGDMLCEECFTKIPYSQEDYEKAKEQELDLDDWDDYSKFYGLGKEVDYD